VLTALLQPRQHDGRNHVSEAGGAERQDDVRPHEDRRREGGEGNRRAGNTNTEEHHERFAVAVAGSDQTPLQLAHLGRRLRRDAPHPLERGRHLFPRRRFHGQGVGAPDLGQTAFDVAGKARCKRHVGGVSEQRNEQECQERQQDRHVTPRS
jgi:hypothetical protein